MDKKPNINVTINYNVTDTDIKNRKLSIPLQSVPNDVIINILGCAVYDDIDKDTGEVKTVCMFKDVDGELYTSISAVIFEQVDDIIDVLAGAESVNVKVAKRKSKGGRDFIGFLFV